MKTVKLFTFILFIIQAVISNAQFQYPYQPAKGNESIQAYWYAVPTDSVVNPDTKRTTSYFYSTLHVYGYELQDDFNITVKAFQQDKMIFEKNIHINNGKSTDDETKYFVTPNKYFRIECPTRLGLLQPNSIQIEIKNEKEYYTKTILCKYHTINGHITDFDEKPFKGFFALSPDDFPNVIGVWADDYGYYSISLPERHYNTFYSDDHTYGISTLEYWGWRMIVDQDETLDIKTGNGEVYNLHAWASNGGGHSYFLYFRPMVLPLAKNKEKALSEININEHIFENMGIAPDLKENDVMVTLNSEKLRIISLQPVYETSFFNNKDGSMNAYIIQVERPVSAKAKKLTFAVSYDTYIDVDGERVRVNSLGHVQLYTNLTGLSEF